ncbi:MAG: hypothetical protein WCK77_19435 [Verrucomicrobiota bacterium]
MQEKSERFSEFSERAETLAAKTCKKLSDLPDNIGISPAMFYAYRSGKYPISRKAWRKLEVAERRAGIYQESASIPSVSEGEIRERTSFLNDFSQESENKVLSERLVAVENQLRILTAAISSLLASNHQPP